MIAASGTKETRYPPQARFPEKPDVFQFNGRLRGMQKNSRRTGGRLLMSSLHWLIDLTSERRSNTLGNAQLSMELIETDRFDM